jgi:hypothetical protein
MLTTRLAATDRLYFDWGARGTPWGRFIESQLMMLPLDVHKLLRNTFAAKFTPQFANQMRPTS